MLQMNPLLVSSGGSRGGAQGARAPLLFLDQTEAPGAETIFFGDRPPFPYLKVWIRHWFQFYK